MTDFSLFPFCTITHFLHACTKIDLAGLKKVNI
jgi:hypothetical protein